MSRRPLILVVLAASMLAGCATSPAARLGSSAAGVGAPLPVAPIAPAPLVKAIPGVAGPAPTVTVKAGVVAALAVTASAQTATADIVAVDAQMEALDLLADDGTSYQLQGWFSDLKDSLKRAWQRFKLTREVKAALKHKRERAFELYEGELDTIRKERTSPKTAINDLGAGGKEIVQTWSSTHKGTWAIETRRTIDADGTTQTLALSKTGETGGGLRISVERIRSLVGTDGAYQVVTKSTTAYKDGRQEYAEWTKSVKADGTETIDGYITHRDGNRTEITGTRDADGKVKVEVSKIAPAHNPSPIPSTTPWADPDAEEEEGDD